MAGGGLQVGGYPGWGGTGPGLYPGLGANPTPGSTPNGYTWDPVQKSYTPTVGSASNTADLQKSNLAFQGQQRGMLNAYQQKALDALSNPALALGSGGGNLGNTALMAPVSYPTSGQVSIPDTSAANTAAFGRAKAQAGALGQSALQSLQSSLADRGILGSGAEAQGLTNILASATNPLSDLNVAQTQAEVAAAQHNQDLQAQAAATQFQGDVAQRGQSLQAQEAANQLAQQWRLALYGGQQGAFNNALSGLARTSTLY